MLAALLYSLWPYQLYKSVLFRSGMTFLTTYLLITWVMPMVIRYFRKRGITSDFKPWTSGIKPYTGAPPIMGGGVLILAIICSLLLWGHFNQYVVALVVILVSFGLIGAV
ncbi:MAG: phospho-N-acetylmuramoyl-pentapeptide-transferase, partial [SAR324 cluster bacterium]|nr:phospho-N-acetylmuramoyl-pentapeptide-transferase [SAR324 cluster bacterium]